MVLKSVKEIASNATPLAFIDSLRAVYGDRIKEIEVSKYISGGPGITLTREVLKIKLNNSTKDCIQNIINSLKDEQELAFHSNVHLKSGRKCVPLIDFCFKEMNGRVEKALLDIHKYLGAQVFLFESGRSFHGYALKILSQKEWKSFLGFLLLLNQRDNSFEITDSRWIGHSLEQDFSALRLSNNSDFYLQVPSFKQSY